MPPDTADSGSSGPSGCGSPPCGNVATSADAAGGADAADTGTNQPAPAEAGADAPPYDASYDAPADASTDAGLDAPIEDAADAGDWTEAGAE